MNHRTGIGGTRNFGIAAMALVLLNCGKERPSLETDR